MEKLDEKCYERLLQNSLKGFNGRKSVKLYGENIIRTTIALVHAIEIDRDGNSIQSLSNKLGTQLSLLNWYIINFNRKVNIPFFKITKGYFKRKVFNIETTYNFDTIRQIWNFEYPDDGWYPRISKLTENILLPLIDEVYSISLDYIRAIPYEKRWKNFVTITVKKNI